MSALVVVETSEHVSNFSVVAASLLHDLFYFVLHEAHRAQFYLVMFDFELEFRCLHFNKLNYITLILELTK